MADESIDIDAFLEYVKDKTREGMNKKQIASSLGISTTKLKDFLRRAKDLKRREKG